MKFENHYPPQLELPKDTGPAVLESINVVPSKGVDHIVGNYPIPVSTETIVTSGGHYHTSYTHSPYMPIGSLTVNFEQNSVYLYISVSVNSIKFRANIDKKTLRVVGMRKFVEHVIPDIEIKIRRSLTDEEQGMILERASRYSLETVI